MNSLKKIGVLVGVLTVGVVGAVTYVSEKQTATPILANNTTSTTSLQTIPQTPTPAGTPVTPPQKSVWNYVSDDEEGDDEGSSKTPATPTTPPPPATIPKNYVAVYKNGTYTANGVYNSPGGQDEIAVSVTLTNDIITDTTVTSVRADRTSLRYQDKFIAGYKQYVVGQNINSVNLTVVSGSSLTPDGFNAALTKIKAQAKV